MLGFAYNPASQIVTRTSSNDAFASTSAVNAARGYSVNGLNQYTDVGPNAYSYDYNGNLTGDGLTTFVYDAENRLVSASGAKNATLAYDPLGRLWQVAAPSGTTRFLYDGDELIQEFDGAGTLLRAYVHGPGTDEPLMWYEYTSGWSRRFLHADHQGSIVAVTDSSGNAVAINGYDAWGIPNAANQGRFGYTGQAWLPELGMWYYKARIYSPTLGRFMQTDPVGYKGGINLYEYAAGDPIDHRDPTGKNPAVVVIVVEGAEICAANPLCRTVAIWAAKEVVRALVPHILPPMPAPSPPGSGRPTPQEEKPNTAKGTTSEARRLGPGPYRCSNPLCDAPHGGATGTTECPDCDGKRRRGDQIPGKPRPLPPVPPRPKPAVKD